MNINVVTSTGIFTDLGLDREDAGGVMATLEKVPVKNKGLYSNGDAFRFQKQSRT